MVKRGQQVIASVADSLPRPGHKRAKVEDPITEKVAAIAEALADTSVEIPGALSCREMLQAMLPSVLGVPCSERHSYQAAVAAMIGEVLKTSQDSWEQKVSDSQRIVETAETDRSSLHSVLDGATVQLQSQQADVKSCKEQVQVHAEAEKEACKVLAEADEEVRDFDDVQLSKAKDLEQCNSIYKDNFEVLKLATEPLNPKDQKTCIATLMAFVKKLGADTSLRTAIPETLKKVPAERGTFDGLVVDQADALFKDHMAKLQTALDNGDAMKAEKVEVQAQAQKGLEAAKANHSASKEALQNACDTLISRQSETKDAKKALDSKVQDFSLASTQLSENQKQFQKATDLFSMFTFLLERDVVPEVVPEVPVEKEVPMTEEVTAVVEETTAPTMMEEAAAVVEDSVMQVAITA